MATKKSTPKTTKPLGECCAGMIGVLAEENPASRKGIYAPLMLSMSTGKSRKNQLAYVPTGRKARVWFLNYCPWCGTNISKPEGE